ncbi:MAG: phosphoribosyltransferase family protein [Chitinophagaceae bacterium]|nr:phosphoribosyltransferase family protein [Chitinophagaceae bacterium]
MQTNYSLHKINHPDVFSFNPAHYSRFKFGDDVIAEDFGIALANGFIEKHLKTHPIENQVVVISSPYAFIPTATFAMKNYFIYTLNIWLVENNFPVVQEAKVYRTVTYKEDYGALNAEERMKLISNDSFHIDSAFIKNKTLIFLDDIKITGSHEKLINKMINEYSLCNDTYFLYYAELVNKSIHPSIENELNFYYVKSIFDLDTLINDSRFFINTRIVKYILNAEKHMFAEFIQNQSTHFIHLLYNMALGNSYHLMEAYTTNLNFLKKLLTFTKIKHSEYGN